MSTVEKKVVTINILKLKSYRAELPRIYSPLTLQHIMQALPLKGTAMKKGTRLVLPTELKVRPEKPRSDFEKGQLSIDPSSGNISIHLQSGEIQPAENYLGSIIDDFDPSSLGLTTGILIKEVETE